MLYLPLKQRVKYLKNEIASSLDSIIDDKSSETSNFSEYLEHRNNKSKEDDVQIFVDFRKESYEKEIEILKNVN